VHTVLEQNNNAIETMQSRAAYHVQQHQQQGYRRVVPTSPRKGRDKKSINSQQQQQQRPSITMVFGEKLRRPQRFGFQSLPNEKGASEPESSELPTEEVATEEDSVLVGLLAFLYIEGRTTDDDVSELKMLLDDPKSLQDTSHDWW
jgi:hypothetical protein